MAALQKSALHNQKGGKRAATPNVEANRREFRGLLTRVNPEALKARLSAIELDTTLQALGVEALNKRTRIERAPLADEIEPV